MTRKLDMRYASDRAKARQRAGTAAPPAYRAALLQAAKHGQRDLEHLWPEAPKTRRHPYGIEIRNLASETNLSSGTIQAALKGEATKIETLKTLADFFGIPWLMLFDIDARLAFNEAGECVGLAKPKPKRRLGKGEIDLG